MKRAKGALLALALLWAFGAQAMATADIDITNQTPWQVYALGDTFGATPTGELYTGGPLAVGFAKGYEFDYRLSVSSGGLPATMQQQYGPFYSGSGIYVYYSGGYHSQGFIPFDGYEIGFANLMFWTDCNYVCGPDMRIGLPSVILRTDPGGVPSEKAVSGHAVVYVGCAGMACAQLPEVHMERMAFALSAPVAPVPEPATWALFACGIAGLTVWRRHVRRVNVSDLIA